MTSSRRYGGCAAGLPHPAVLPSPASVAHDQAAGTGRVMTHARWFRVIAVRSLVPSEVLALLAGHRHPHLALAVGDQVAADVDDDARAGCR